MREERERERERERAVGVGDSVGMGEGVTDNAQAYQGSAILRSQLECPDHLGARLCNF